jgi:hypothetical protein
MRMTTPTSRVGATPWLEIGEADSVSAREQAVPVITDCDELTAVVGADLTIQVNMRFRWRDTSHGAHENDDLPWNSHVTSSCLK